MHEQTAGDFALHALAGDVEVVRGLLDADEAVTLTMVTNNSRDFRGQGPAGPGGRHARQEIHAGLVCLNSAYPMTLDRQHRLFKIALDELAGTADLVNLALEVFEHADLSIDIELYEIPMRQDT